jgi:PAS domain S-box-containing protein
MVILNQITNLSFLQRAFFDAIIIVILTFPSVYFFLFKPLIALIRKRDEAELILKKSEERYRNIFENVQDVYYEVTLDGIILEISPSISLISDGTYIRGDLLGSSVYDLYADPEERKVLLSILHKEGKVRDYEIKLKNKDGSLFNCSISARISYNNQHVPTKITGSMRDISNRKRTEEEIRKMNDQLRIINSEKDKLFSIISHDLRGPIGTFIGLTELMVHKGNDLKPKEIKKFAISLHQSATNLYSLLENLLLWSVSKQSTLAFAPKKLHLQHLVNDVVLCLVPAAERKNIKINCHIQPVLEIKADFNSLQTIIRNLVSNAIKFTPFGGEVTIRAESGKRTRISISDTGIGMDSDMVTKLFSIDSKINRPGTDGELSTGLGLLLVKEMVEKHGGHITVESEVNKGTVIYFTI